MPGIRYFQCPRCNGRAFSIRSLFRHLHTMHGHEGSWVCGLSGCMRTYRLFSSYKKHVYRSHGEMLMEPAHVDNMAPGSLQLGENASETDVNANGSDSDMHALEGMEVHEETEENEVCISGAADYVKQLATLLLKWKERRRLPESTLHEIANDVIFFLKAILEDIQLQTSSELAEALEKVLPTEQLDQLLTASGRAVYWKIHFPFIEPKTITLGTLENGKVDTMEYVPLCDVLKCTLEHELSEGPSWQAKEDNFMCSVFDGDAFREHSYFAGDSSKICLQLYSDEFEVCNPLGSRRGKQKMTAVYFSVLNLSPKSRSALSGINLALLVKDKLVSKYGLQKCLAPLLEDVRILERDGIVVNGKVLKGSVFVFSGDNLSSHRMGGFKCSFSHGRICRFCMALRTQINYKHLESDYVLRSPAGHQHHLAMLRAGLPTTSLYGVRSHCAVQCEGFDPTQHLPPDIMHDLHEGVIPFAMRYLVNYFISEGFFTLSHLNKCIRTWNYDPSDVRNKPEPLTKEFLQGKAPFKGSATQTFCLFRHFSLFVGECIPSENEAWHLYLLLRDILDILMSRKIPLSHIPYLQRKITFFCMDFTRLFPCAPVPCKMHYLIHYPSCIQKFGPLIQLWAMRFEAKHQYFKDVSRKIHNFKNLAHSLALRHQYLQCFSFIAGERKDIPSNAGCHRVVHEHLPEIVKEYIVEHNLHATPTFSVNSVSLNGRMYKAGCVIVRSMSEDAHPKFLHLCEILYLNKFLVVIGKVLHTAYFDEHFHLYVVRVTDDCEILTSFPECTDEPLYLQEHRGRTVVNTRFGLF